MKSPEMQIFDWNLTRDHDRQDIPGKRGRKFGCTNHPQKSTHKWKQPLRSEMWRSGKRAVRNEDGFKWEKVE